MKNNLYINILYKKIFIYNCHLKPLLIFYFSFFLFKNFGKDCEKEFVTVIQIVVKNIGINILIKINRE